MKNNQYVQKNGFERMLAKCLAAKSVVKPENIGENVRTARIYVRHPIKEENQLNENEKASPFFKKWKVRESSILLLWREDGFEMENNLSKQVTSKKKKKYRVAWVEWISWISVTHDWHHICVTW